MMLTSSKKHLISLIFVLLTLLGCATTPAPKPPEEVRSDEEITQEVTDKLNERFPLGTPRNFIAVKTVTGTVYLSGTIESAIIKETAEVIARNVEGVEGVVNSILVRPRP
jgi:osmotically-inducible protein OsmY